MLINFSSIPLFGWTNHCFWTLDMLSGFMFYSFTVLKIEYLHRDVVIKSFQCRYEFFCNILSILIYCFQVRMWFLYLSILFLFIFLFTSFYIHYLLFIISLSLNFLLRRKIMLLTIESSLFLHSYFWLVIVVV